LRRIRPFALLLLALASVAPAGEVLANACRSIQAELAAIGNGPSAGERQSANRQAAEAQRIHAHMRAIGCDRGGLFSFGSPPPPECPGLRARMQQLQQAYQPAARSEGRRRELMSMLVSYNCRTSPDPLPKSQPLVAGLFDDRSRRPSSLEIRPDDDDDLNPPRIESRIRSVSGHAVCVRTCDGFYFPVQVRPGTAPEDGDQICQSLCPATEAKLYTMRSRDIEQARSAEGAAYSELPNAFVYRKRFDPACFCRQPGESWGDRNARVLNPDDAGAPGFDALNPDSSDLPEDVPLRGLEGHTGKKPAGKKADTSVFGKRRPPEPPAPPHPVVETPAERTVTTAQGEVREFKARDGSSRSVRIIAPELSRGPEEARAPSAPDRAPAP
jgi:Protein of unknown function (DUF2865)